MQRLLFKFPGSQLSNCGGDKVDSLVLFWFILVVGWVVGFVVAAMDC